MKRGYQPGFYGLSEKVRDRESRQRKADKIQRVLVRYAAEALPAGVCVDIGCSSGTMTRRLAPLGRQTVGLDYDAIGLAAVDQDAQDRVRFVRGDAMTLPFADASVDLLVCAQVYEHVPDDRTLFREMLRVLRPGAVAFFSGPNWLFPIELHYGLPFVHWLPVPLANGLLRLTGRGDHYYERSRSAWSLRRALRPFEIRDANPEVVALTLADGGDGWSVRVARQLPRITWRLLSPLMPNFNWILRKPGSP